MPVPVELYRWIRADEVVPGLLVQSPYGGDVVLEVEEKHEEQHEDGVVIVFAGWRTDPRTGAEARFTDGRWRPNSPLWLIGDLRDVKAY